MTSYLYTEDHKNPTKIITIHHLQSPTLSLQTFRKNTLPWQGLSEMQPKNLRILRIAMDRTDCPVPDSESRSDRHSKARDVDLVGCILISPSVKSKHQLRQKYQLEAQTAKPHLLSFCTRQPQKTSPRALTARVGIRWSPHLHHRGICAVRLCGLYTHRLCTASAL